MAPPPPPPSLAAEEAALSTLLAEFRLCPPANIDLDPLLARLTTYLRALDAAGQGEHWFCAEAREVTREAAGFLLRLHAYDSEEVGRWKERCWAVGQGCWACAEGHEDAKRRSRTTYLANFSLAVQDAFFASITAWEHTRLLADLSSLAFALPPSPPTPGLTLARAPHALHRMLVNPSLLRSPDLLRVLESYLPSSGERADFPPTPVPPGLLLLLVHPSPAVRTWAHLHSLPSPPIPLADFPRLAPVLRALVHHLEGRMTEWAGCVSGEGAVLWEGLGRVVGLLSPEAVQEGLLRMHGVDVVHVVTAHLHASDSTFPHVLKTFMRLLERAGPAVWALDRPEFPEVVYDSIKDNPAFERLLASSASAPSPSPTPASGQEKEEGGGEEGEKEAEPWFLTVFQVLLQSVGDIDKSEQVWGALFAKVVQFMGEELQHARFGEGVRGVVMRVVLSTMTFVHLSARTPPDHPNPNPKRQEYIATIISIQSSHIAAVAFSPSFRGPVWAHARLAARQLLETVFRSDTEVLGRAAAGLAEVVMGAGRLVEARARAEEKGKKIAEDREKVAALRREADELVRAVVTNPALWYSARAELGKSAGEEGEGVVLLAEAVLPVLHLSLDPHNAFNPAPLSTLDPALGPAVRTAVERVNAGLDAVRTGLDGLLSGFALAASPSSIHALLSRPAFVSTTIRLVLSHDEDVSSAAQSLVGQTLADDALDAPARTDCFRSLLLSAPAAALDGLCAHLELFADAAQRFPEACGMARWMVRCLADVLDALCSARDGLLGRADVVGSPEMPRRVFRLWAGMCRASETVFRLTPGWAKYYETRVMADWMRDALIFVRELVGNFRRFEAAVNGRVDDAETGTETETGLTSIGRKIVTALDGVARNIVAWLRLTDDELLHQSTELIGAVLGVYARCGVRPPGEAVATVEKYVMGVKTAGKLTREQLGGLGEAVRGWVERVGEEEGEGEEVQVVGETKGKGRERERERQEKGKGKSQMEVFNLIRPAVVNGPKKSSRPESRAEIPLLTAADIRGRSRRAPPKADARSAAGGGSSLMAQLRHDHNQERTRIAATVRPRRHEPKNEALVPPKPVESDSSAVSSSSSEDDDSDADGEGEFEKMIKSSQKSPAAKKPKSTKPKMAFKLAQPVRRQVIMLDEGGVANPVLQRVNQRQEAERAQLRLKPDMGPFVRKVLSWDYSAPGDTPPYAPDQRPTLARVPDAFGSYEEYRRHFEPLLMYECWSGLVKSKEEAVQGAFACSVAGRHNVDDWLDLDVAVSTAGLAPGWTLQQDTDLVLLRQKDGEKAVLAKVQTFRRGARGIELSLRVCLGLRDQRGLNGALQLRTEWRGQKVFSFSTIFREYGALQSLPYYDMFSEIMKPRPARLPTFPEDQVKRAMSAYQVNEPQAVAILGALQTDGFSLIQGPPGTGKTKTICGLVGCWLSTQRTRTTVRPDGKPSKPKILICAPSNAAIDEVAKRVRAGVRNASGQRIVPNVVRIGNENSVNISVKPITLDALIESRINGDAALKADASAGKIDVAAIRRELDLISAQRQSKEAELASIRDNAARSTVINAELKTLVSKRLALTKELQKGRDAQTDTFRTMDAARRKFRNEVLMDADVICCTLSGAGQDSIAQLDFETVIIDEAAQSVELSSLIPLRFRCRRCIMVGDPEQLPPTVLSQTADSYGYSRSLFVRLMKQRPEAVHLLSIQYRMHPDISKLSSTLFYNSKLTDGPDMATKTAQPWHADSLFGPFRFFDVVEGEEGKAKMGYSLVNQAEANAVMAMYDRLKAEFKRVNFDFRIGVVTMYREQMFQLRKMFKQRYGELDAQTIDFNTVDGFQGQEKDIIILSCVRAGATVGSVGFLGDRRRTNVAITRARSSLFILGNAATLERSDPIWRSIVQNARERSLLTQYNASTFRMAYVPPTAPVVRTTPQRPKQQQPPVPPVEKLIPLKPSTSQRPVPKPAQSPAQASTSSSTAVSDSGNNPLKRKNSSDGPRRPPPALRHPAQAVNGTSSNGRPPTQSQGGSGRGTPVAIPIPIPIPIPPPGSAPQQSLPKGNRLPPPGSSVAGPSAPRRGNPIPTPSDSTTMFIPKKRPAAQNPAPPRPPPANNVRERIAEDLRHPHQPNRNQQNRPNGNQQRPNGNQQQRPNGNQQRPNGNQQRPNGNQQRPNGNQHNKQHPNGNGHR